MIDLEDMLGFGFEEEPEIVESYEAQPESETSGGWGSFLLGRAVGALWSGAGKNKINNYSNQPEVFDSFSDDEKVFLRQIWRFEEEFNKAPEEDLTKEQWTLIWTHFSGDDRQILTRIVQRWGSHSDELKQAVLRVVE